jgi:hypothetical protein
MAVTIIVTVAHFRIKKYKDYKKHFALSEEHHLLIYLVGL